jgi:hypothetical protein
MVPAASFPLPAALPMLPSSSPILPAAGAATAPGPGHGSTHAVSAAVAPPAPAAAVHLVAAVVGLGPVAFAGAADAAPAVVADLGAWLPLGG